MVDGKRLTLAIETSCDETAAAVVSEGRQVLSSVVASQIDIHKAFGGVVPEIASRHHLEQINRVTAQALAEAGLGFSAIDLIGVTQGPGLVGALLIGLATAKAYAYATGKPLVGVNHIQGHICANYIAHKELAPPFTALVLSGGHTSLLNVSGYNRFSTLGKTRDDAVGEAYDKVARVLGLGYPGGPLIDALAKQGDPRAVFFKRVYLEKNSFDFSFSGTKTGVLQYVNAEKQAGRPVNAADVAAGFQLAVMEVIVEKAVRAAKMGETAGAGGIAEAGSAGANEAARTENAGAGEPTEAGTAAATGSAKLGEAAAAGNRLVLAGGVAANSLLRTMLSDACAANGIALYYPPLDLCTDNAAMIGCAAHYKYMEYGEDDLTIDARRVIFPHLGT